MEANSTGFDKDHLITFSKVFWDLALFFFSLLTSFLSLCFSVCLAVFNSVANLIKLHFMGNTQTAVGGLSWASR